MKKTFAMMIFLFISSLVQSGSKKDPYLIDDRKVIMYRTYKYYKSEDGVSRPSEDFDKYLYSAWHVSEMFPVYPAKNQTDRMLKFFCFGAKETGYYKKNFIVFNIPGFKYSGLPPGHFVREFSCDYSWVGINIDNLLWAYDVAYRLQNDMPFPDYLQLSSKTIKELKKCHIPKDLHLKKFDEEDLKIPRLIYKKFLKKKYRPGKIRRLMMKAYADGVINYSENTQDDVDSMLCYRVIIEVERKNKGWEFQGYDKELYNYINRHAKFSK